VIKQAQGRFTLDIKITKVI